MDALIVELKYMKRLIILVNILLIALIILTVIESKNKQSECDLRKFTDIEDIPTMCLSTLQK